MGKIKFGDVTAKDMEEAASQGDFEPPQPGLYVFKLAKVEPKYAQTDGNDDKSRPYLSCQWNTVGVGRDNVKPEIALGSVWDNVSFSESTKWKRAEFLLALGKKPGAEIEIDEGKPGTVIGSIVLGRVKRDANLDGEYRPRMGKLSAYITTESDGGDTGGNDPFATAEETTEEEPEGVTVDMDELEGLDLKELGAWAKENFDMDPNGYLVKENGKVNLDLTKVSLLGGIAEAAGIEGYGEDESSPGEDESPF